ncbi:MAG: NUDIX hydrolase [Candidatus Coatesbacteria bacterium]|nr:NUDIX hydrolase [Candidatus Coatesbacteria bacterium]
MPDCSERREEERLPKSSAAAIITRDMNGETEILLTLRNSPPLEGVWCLPGGHVDQGETARDAVIREVKEETGLDFDARFFKCFDEVFPEYGIFAVVSVFEGRASGKLKPQIDEVAELRWFPVQKARSMRLAFCDNEILDCYFGQSEGAGMVPPESGGG